MSDGNTGARPRQRWLDPARLPPPCDDAVRVRIVPDYAAGWLRSCDGNYAHGHGGRWMRCSVARSGCAEHPSGRSNRESRRLNGWRRGSPVSAAWFVWCGSPGGSLVAMGPWAKLHATTSFRPLGRETELLKQRSVRVPVRRLLLLFGIPITFVSEPDTYSFLRCWTRFLDGDIYKRTYLHTHVHTNILAGLVHLSIHTRSYPHPLAYTFSEA